MPATEAPTLFGDVEAAGGIVHQLVEAIGSQSKLVTKCGKTVRWKVSEGIPGDVTIWGSGVTCPGCLERR